MKFKPLNPHKVQNHELYIQAAVLNHTATTGVEFKHRTVMLTSIAEATSAKLGLVLQ